MVVVLVVDVLTDVVAHESCCMLTDLIVASFWNGGGLIKDVWHKSFAFQVTQSLWTSFLRRFCLRFQSCCVWSLLWDVLQRRFSGSGFHVGKIQKARLGLSNKRHEAATSPLVPFAVCEAAKKHTPRKNSTKAKQTQLHGLEKDRWRSKS